MRFILIALPPRSFGCALRERGSLGRLRPGWAAPPAHCLLRTRSVARDEEYELWAGAPEKPSLRSRWHWPDRACSGTGRGDRGRGEQGGVGHRAPVAAARERRGAKELAALRRQCVAVVVGKRARVRVGTVSGLGRSRRVEAREESCRRCPGPTRQCARSRGRRLWCRHRSCRWRRDRTRHRCQVCEDRARGPRQR